MVCNIETPMIDIYAKLKFKCYSKQECVGMHTSVPLHVRVSVIGSEHLSGTVLLYLHLNASKV